jgi:hypothetical protein
VFAAAACNTSQTGANGNVEFTPTQCGQIGGCDFEDSIGVGGVINVTLNGLDGFSTAGLDLASRDPSLMDVRPGEDVGGEPSWEVQSLGAGVVELAALDRDGNEVDFIEVPMQEDTRLTMEPVAGDIVGPVAEGDIDEAFQVNADALVSWSIRPVIAGDVTTMGRYQFQSTEAIDLSAYETESSDRANGYLYLQLPIGDYPIVFELADNADIFVTAIIHAVGP